MPFDPSWLTSGGAAVLRVVLSALLAYVGTVVALRTFGKRSIAKLSAFDFVVTVALGSALASIVLARDTPIVESPRCSRSSARSRSARRARTWCDGSPSRDRACSCAADACSRTR